MLYEKTQQLAARRPVFKQILAALDRTLDYFQLTEDRQDVGEILLQIRMNPEISLQSKDAKMRVVQAVVEKFREELAKENLPPITYLVFVYGTMKRGFPLNVHLEGQRFIAGVTTQPQYRMYVHQQGWYPCLVETDGGLAIEGELWEVSEETLCQMDRAEGTMFHRTTIQIAAPYDQELIEGYLYKYEITPEFADVGACWQGPDDSGEVIE